MIYFFRFITRIHMIYTDTRDKNVKVNFQTAVLKGMNPETGGLYIPTFFPKLDFFQEHCI